MSRFSDLFFAITASFLLLIPFLFIAIMIKLSSPGPVFFWSKRIGINNTNFFMPKFRTMKIEAPNVATDKLDQPEKYITSFGFFLRKSSLDELPQLYSILKGEMSFIGPRPALFNQYDLIELRNEYKIYKLMPGITGWAQVNGRDEITLQQKVNLEKAHLENKSFSFNLLIIYKTVIKIIKQENVSH